MKDGTFLRRGEVGMECVGIGHLAVMACQNMRFYLWRTLKRPEYGPPHVSRTRFIRLFFKVDASASEEVAMRMRGLGRTVLPPPTCLASTLHERDKATHPS